MLKSLFQVSIIGGTSPIVSDDGVVLQALLKKDNLVENEDLVEDLI